MLLPVISKLRCSSNLHIFAFLVPASVAFFYDETEVSVLLTSFWQLSSLGPHLVLFSCSGGIRAQEVFC